MKNHFYKNKLKISIIMKKKKQMKQIKKKKRKIKLVSQMKKNQMKKINYVWKLTMKNKQNKLNVLLHSKIIYLGLITA